MDYAAEPAANNVSPNQHDYDQLVSIYAHPDTSTTIRSSTSSTMADDTGAKPYKTERRDSRKSSTITEYFADDSRRVTSIVWAG